MSKRKGYRVDERGTWQNAGPLKFKKLAGRSWPPHWPRKPYDLEAAFHATIALQNDPRFAGVVREIEQLGFGSESYTAFWNIVATFPHPQQRGRPKGSDRAHLIPQVLEEADQGKKRTAAAKAALAAAQGFTPSKGAADHMVRTLPKRAAKKAL